MLVDDLIARVPPETWADRLRTTLGGALDEAVLRGMTLAFESVLLPPLAEFPDLRRSATPYLSRELRDDPGRFFAPLPSRRPLPEPNTEPAPDRSVPGGVVVTRQFASDYVPYHLVAGAEACAANESIWVEHWMHASRPSRPTLIGLHGFTMGWPWLDARVMMAERWFELGLDVVMLTLPFHGRRASTNCRYSGERFASWNVGRLNEAVRQAVYDADLVLQWLRAQGVPVGVLGLSLGGYIAALLASLHRDLAFVIPVAPAVCLAELPTRLFAYSRYGRAGFTPPLTQAELRAGYRVHSPLAHRLRTPRERVLMIAGRGDAVTPLTHALDLWRHWQRPSAIWFNGGHVAPFERSRIAAAIAGHLEVLGLTGGGSRRRPRRAYLGARKPQAA